MTIDIKDQAKLLEFLRLKKEKPNSEMNVKFTSQGIEEIFILYTMFLFTIPDLNQRSVLDLFPAFIELGEKELNELILEFEDIENNQN